jgi:hypothetical protein
MAAPTGPLPAASKCICIANVAVKNIQKSHVGSEFHLRAADDTIFNPIRGLEIALKIQLIL